MRVAIFGCGNMTQSIFRGAAQKGDLSNDVFETYTPSHERAVELAEVLGGRAQRSIDSMRDADVFFIGCKPQQVEALAESLDPNENRLVISILAGTPIVRISQLFCSSRVIRVMPSTPARVGRGVSLMVASEEIEKTDLHFARGIFESISSVVENSSEDELDLMTAVTGSGPAYVFEFARILSEWLLKRGVSAEVADLAVRETLGGSAELLRQESQQTPLSLRDQVTSKGGATAKALDALQEFQWEQHMHTALDSAHRRVKELAQS